MYRRILVPLEHSSSDDAILNHVRELARLCHSSLLLIHVADRLLWQMASQIEDGDVVTTGVASTLAVLAIALARATHAPRLTYLASVGAIDPRIARVYPSSEDLAYLDGRAASFTIPDLFDHARRGRLDTVFFGAGEVDAHGSTNVSTTKFPGASAACTLRRWCKRPILVVPKQSRRALVPRVGIRSTDDPRRTTLLTDLARFSVGPGGAVLEAIAPHASLEMVTTRTGFEFSVGDVLGTALIDPPLAKITALDPHGLRYELVGGPA